MKVPFKMPDVDVGWIVLWHSTGNENAAPFPAVVLGVGYNTIDVAVLGRSPALMPKIGVRHITDESRNDLDNQVTGAWQHTAFTKMMLKALDVHGADELDVMSDTPFFFSDLAEIKAARAKRAKAKKDLEDAEKRLAEEDAKLPATAQL